MPKVMQAMPSQQRRRDRSPSTRLGRDDPDELRGGEDLAGLSGTMQQNAVTCRNRTRQAPLPTQPKTPKKTR
jgi:hypothetical protein